MVKNGFYSSFPVLSPVWACLLGKSWRCCKMADDGVPPNSEESRVFHKLLRLNLAPLEFQGTAEEPKSDTRLRIASKSENKNYDHF
jgi:hypothetical protein